MDLSFETLLSFGDVPENPQQELEGESTLFMLANDFAGAVPHTYHVHLIVPSHLHRAQIVHIPTPEIE
jgi:hypothetical protein